MHTAIYVYAYCVHIMHTAICVSSFLHTVYCVHTTLTAIYVSSFLHAVYCVHTTLTAIYVSSFCVYALFCTQYAYTQKEDTYIAVSVV